MLSIVSAAQDLGLLTIEELAAAAGLDPSDNSDDEALIEIGLRAAAAIARDCRIVPAGTYPPTLRLETLTETFLPVRRRLNPLLLARRPIETPEAITIVENGTTLAVDQYQVDEANGLLVRMCGSKPGEWSCGQIVVTYSAGWSTVPDDLKQAAVRMVEIYSAQGGKDPGARSEEVPDVYRVTYMSPGDQLGERSALPPDVVRMLAPYSNAT